MNILPTRIGLSLVAALFSLGLSATAAHAGDVRVGATISTEIAPGVYGRVNIGDVQPSVLVYPQPIIIEQTSRYYPEPIYLHVPPGHAKDWRKHCWRYNACNQHVYFVRSREYESDYRPRYEGRERHYERDRDHDRDHDRRDNRDYERRNDRDHDHDNGNHGNHGNRREN